jgi:hypothetical protein
MKNHRPLDVAVGRQRKDATGADSGTVGGRLRRVATLLSVTASLATIVAVAPLSVSANNDPHRFFEPSGPVDLPVGYCAFPVHVDFSNDREYGTLSTLPDGSTVVVTTGSLTVTATNSNTGKSMEFNSGGPGTVTTPPSGRPIMYDLRGRSLLLGTNQQAFGLPSNLVATSGPVHAVEDIDGLGGLPFGTISSLTGNPHVITDVCAALA